MKIRVQFFVYPRYRLTENTAVRESRQKQSKNPFKRGRILSILLLSEDPADAHRLMRRLALARLLLALCSLALCFYAAAGARPAPVWFFVLFAAYSLILYAFLEWRPDLGLRFRLAMLSADIACLTILAIIGGGSNGAFYLLVLYILGSAALYRGFRETAAAAILTGALIYLGNTVHESYFLQHKIGLSAGNFAESLIPLAYVLVAGLLVGLGAEEIKELHAERVAIARILGGIQPQASLDSTLSRICAEVLRVFGAGKVLVALLDKSGRTVHLSEAQPYGPAESALRFEQVDEDQSSHYFFPEPGRTWAAEPQRSQQGARLAAFVLDADSRRVHRSPVDLPHGFLAMHPCRSLVVHSFDPGPDWSARIFILDPEPVMCSRIGLYFMSALASHVWPAVFDAYLARKLHQRATEMERASIARELHDGAIQSLVAIDMKLETLRSRIGNDGDGAGEKIESIQEYLRREVHSLRSLMQRLKAPDLNSRECVQALRIAAAQFEEDSGIPARFESRIDEVALPPRVCGEIVRIFQEALVNVRKHSAAHSVGIVLQECERGYALEIVDDGRGFDFNGRLSLEALDAQDKGPAILKERIRLIAGDLTIESAPGKGARLEVVIPRGVDERQRT